MRRWETSGCGKSNGLGLVRKRGRTRRGARGDKAKGEGRKILIWIGCNSLLSPDFGRIKPSKIKSLYVDLAVRQKAGAILAAEDQSG